MTLHRALWAGLASLAVLVAGGPRCGYSDPLPSRPQWWQPSMAVDYALIAASGATVWALWGRSPPQGSAIGPSFDPQRPAAVLDPALAVRIGKPHVAQNSGERVPTAAMAYAIVPALAWVVLQEGIPAWRSGQSGALQVHEAGVGLVEALGLTLATTEAGKALAGRLRPDFQERVRRFYCAEGDPQGVPCTGAEVPLAADQGAARKLLDDGRKSFPSGHASTAFALATYAALATGGRWVWASDATSTSRAVGIGAQAAAIGLAGWVAWGRVADGRHNTSDVVGGALIGAAFANLSYWRRFDGDGRPRRQVRTVTADSWSVSPLGLSMAWHWR
jgi:membrane-associated phospholipid phosphatase